MRLVLWDIDGTLVDTAGHGREAFFEAFERLFERPSAIADLPMAGRTDHAIALDMLERNGIAGQDEWLARMFEELHAALSRRRSLMAGQGRAQPGVREALAGVGEIPGALQSLVTGNIQPNAELKLAAFGLDPLVDLEIGGYGSERGTRSQLVGLALRRARAKHGIDVSAAETVVVGDTPLDVDAGHAAGARVVAVATGPYSVEELEQAGADEVLPDMRDTRALLDALS